MASQDEGSETEEDEVATAGHRAAPAIGPNVYGTSEQYRLDRKLQSSLFGAVYQAKGLCSGRNFAVKILHKSDVGSAKLTSSLEFCEVPLSELTFRSAMQGHENVMEVEDYFDDAYCHYVVFEMAEGGDLLEALKLRPSGFDEPEAQFLMRQAAMGLASLHQKRIAMQDVSLENMLICFAEGGKYRIKVCDPGQAVLFQTDSAGRELRVGFNGFVGKSFRPPELQEGQPYYASKVDAWCFGWSVFYLLAAQPLFLSADPDREDPDWALFESEGLEELLKRKGQRFSSSCADLLQKLMTQDPVRRLSISDALEHSWLADPCVPPMYKLKAADAEAEDAPTPAEQPGSTATSAGTNSTPVHQNCWPAFPAGKLPTTAPVAGSSSSAGSAPVPAVSLCRPDRSASPAGPCAALAPPAALASASASAAAAAAAAAAGSTSLRLCGTAGHAALEVTPMPGSRRMTAMSQGSGSGSGVVGFTFPRTLPQELLNPTYLAAAQTETPSSGAVTVRSRFAAGPRPYTDATFDLNARAVQRLDRAMSPVRPFGALSQQTLSRPRIGGSNPAVPGVVAAAGIPGLSAYRSVNRSPDPRVAPVAMAEPMRPPPGFYWRAATATNLVGSRVVKALPTCTSAWVSAWAPQPFLRGRTLTRGYSPVRVPSPLSADSCYFRQARLGALDMRPASPCVRAYSRASPAQAWKLLSPAPPSKSSPSQLFSWNPSPPSPPLGARAASPTESRPTRPPPGATKSAIPRWVA